MITVAKGGGAGSAVSSSDFCDKYPDDKKCTGVDFLPMLLAVPRMSDYQHGMALLGLGDIVCTFQFYGVVFCMVSFLSPCFYCWRYSTRISRCVWRPIRRGETNRRKAY